MVPFIVIILLLTAGVIIYLIKFTPTDKIKRGEFLQAFAHFFEGVVLPITDHANSYRVDFRYRGNDCSYEDLELPGLRPGSEINVGYLKIKTPTKLTLTFSERLRTQIRSNAQTLDEVSSSRWGKFEGQVPMPKSLGEFHAYTNEPEWATRFIQDPKNLKFFEAYKNRDSRGHPLMSLNIVDGVVGLEFHATGGLKPSLLILEHNVTAAESYLQELIELAESLKLSDSERPK